MQSSQAYQIFGASLVALRSSGIVRGTFRCRCGSMSRYLARVLLSAAHSPRRCSEQALESANRNFPQHSLSRRRLGKGFGQDRLRDILLEAVTTPIRTAGCSIVGSWGPSIGSKRAPERWISSLIHTSVNAGDNAISCGGARQIPITPVLTLPRWKTMDVLHHTLQQSLP